MCLLLSDITTDIYIETANFSLQTRHFQVGVGEHQGDPYPADRVITTRDITLPS